VKALRLATLLYALSGVAGTAVLLAGCGSGSANASTPAAERLQREDLVAVARGLRQAEPSARREMAAARIAWPLVANGLPAKIPPATLTALSTASRAAHAIVLGHNEPARGRADAEHLKVRARHELARHALGLAVHADVHRDGPAREHAGEEP